MLDEKKGVYAGSFDPVHNGHISTAVSLIQTTGIDTLAIGVGHNPDKATSFSFHHQERAAMIRDALQELPEHIRERIHVCFVKGLLVDYCQKQGIKYIFKTRRNEADFRDESIQAYYNKTIDPTIETHLIKADFSHALPYVSSSGEKTLMKLQGNQQGLHTTLLVKQALEARINHQYIIGMTGEMGAGKSYVGEQFTRIGASFNIPTTNIDFDALGHRILQAGEDYAHVRAEIQEVFGTHCMRNDGSIDRGILGSIVFHDSKKMQQLNAIMKAPLATELRHALYEKKGLIIINSALLAEHQIGQLVNNTVVSVTSKEATREERVLYRENNDSNIAKRKGRALTSEDIKERSSLQRSTAQKEQYFAEAQEEKRYGKTIRFDNTTPSDDDFVQSFLNTVDTVDTDLSLRFSSIYSALGLLGNAQILFQDIYFRYLDNNLAYHNWQHIKAGIRYIYTHWNSLKDPALVAMARFFHDIIYSTQGGDENVYLSAEYASEKLLAHGMNPGNIHKIRNLILATDHAKERITRDKDHSYIIDIDMSILGSPQNIYNQHAQNIREEYKSLPDAVYIPARIKVLQGFLGHTIFHTSEFVKLQKIAEANIGREISMLQQRQQ